MAVISPQGGSIRQLLVDGFEIVPEFSLSNPIDYVYGNTLAPWPNRLEDGRYEFGGRQYGFVDLDQQGNKNHGLVLDAEFEIRLHQTDHLVLGYRFGEDPGYPFDVDLEISYRLLSDGLEVTAQATNHGVDAPFAIGFHPYFLVGEEFELSASFTHRTVQNARKLPVETIDTLPLLLNRNSKELEILDDCFFGASEVVLTRPEGQIVVQALESLPYFMLYRPNSLLSKSGSVIAIEPQSVMANAFINQPEECLLASGQTRNYGFAIRKR